MSRRGKVVAQNASQRSTKQKHYTDPQGRALFYVAVRFPVHCASSEGATNTSSWFVWELAPPTSSTRPTVVTCWRCLPVQSQVLAITKSNAATADSRNANEGTAAHARARRPSSVSCASI